MQKVNRLGFLFILLLTITFVTACNSADEAVQSEPAEEDPIGQEEEVEEPEQEEENRNEVVVKSETSGEKIVEVEPVTIEQELWSTRENKAYDVLVEVGPIIRDGDLALLPVFMDTNDDVSIDFDSLFRPSIRSGEGITSQQGYDIKLIDTEGMTVSQPAVLLLEDQSSKGLHTFVGGGFNRNSQKIIGGSHEPAQYYGMFAAPETDDVHILFRKLGLIENVPVVDREEIETLTLKDIDELTDEELEQLDQQVAPTVDEIIEDVLRFEEDDAFDGNRERIQARVFPIESYRESLKTSVSRVDEIEHATLIISSDVLFEFDSSDLTEEAGEELEAVVTELEDAEDGALEIVGHTDSEGTEELNQELSENRAASVREALEEVMDLESFDVTVRGESFREPIADNASEEGRAQNRRVEIHFTPPTEQVEIEVETDVPEALGEVAAYPEAVQVEDGEIEIESIRQVDNLLVGRIRVNALEDGGADYTALTFGFGIPVGARGWHTDESVGFDQTVAYAPTLLHNGQRYFPLDYYLDPLEGSYAEEWVEKEGGEKEYIIPLAEHNLFEIRNLEGDGYYTATVIWPAVDDETVTVDLTLPRDFIEETSFSERALERAYPWRITDVPVEKGN
jgi:outer membrane protein OmpA-like peptidoglycan-associated protein